MHLLIFALSALVLAALTGFLSWKDAPKQPLPPDPGPLSPADPGTLSALAETVEALLAVMDKPFSRIPLNLFPLFRIPRFRHPPRNLCALRIALDDRDIPRSVRKGKELSTNN